MKESWYILTTDKKKTFMAFASLLFLFFFTYFEHVLFLMFLVKTGALCLFKKLQKIIFKKNYFLFPKVYKFARTENVFLNLYYYYIYVKPNFRSYATWEKILQKKTWSIQTFYGYVEIFLWTLLFSIPFRLVKYAGKIYGLLRINSKVRFEMSWNLWCDIEWSDLDQLKGVQI